MHTLSTIPTMHKQFKIFLQEESFLKVHLIVFFLINFHRLKFPGFLRFPPETSLASDSLSSWSDQLDLSTNSLHFAMILGTKMTMMIIIMKVIMMMIKTTATGDDAVGAYCSGYLKLIWDYLGILVPREIARGHIQSCLAGIINYDYDS